MKVKEAIQIHSLTTAAFACNHESHRMWTNVSGCSSVTVNIFGIKSLCTKERETVQVCMFYWLLAFLRSNWAVWGTHAEMSVTPVIYSTSSVPFTDTAVDPEADLLRYQL